MFEKEKNREMANVTFHQIIVMGRLQELELVRKDLALDGSSTYEELFAKVLQLAKNKRNALLANFLHLLGTIIMGFVIINSFNPFLYLLLYNLLMFLIRNDIDKKIKKERNKPYYDIAFLGLFDNNYNKLSNDLIMLRNKVYYEYNALLKQKEAFNNVEALDLSKGEETPVVGTVFIKIIPLNQQYHDDKEENKKRADKTKKIGKHPQSKK